MAVLFGPATFPGADWTPWPAGWTFVARPGAFTAQVGGWGRMHAGSQTGYTGKMAARPIGLSVAAARITLRLRFLYNVDGSLTITLRGDDAQDGRTGYVLHLNRAIQQATLLRLVNYSSQYLQQVPYTIDTDVVHEIDFYALGTTIEARVWPQGSPRPAAPTLKAIDSVITAPGAVSLQLIGGSGADMQADVADVQVTDGSGDLLLSGSITPSGVVLKRIPKTLTGQIVPSGSVAAMRVVLQTLTGVIAPFGTLVHAIPRIFTGTTTPVGVVRKQTNKVLAGQVVPSGRFAKAALRTFVGTVTPVGTLTATWIGRIAGVPGKVAMTIRASAWARLRIRGRDADTDAG